MLAWKSRFGGKKSQTSFVIFPIFQQVYALLISSFFSFVDLCSAKNYRDCKSVGIEVVSYAADSMS